MNNNNKGFFNREINFNTQSFASQIINYKDAYILLEIQVDIPYDDSDQGKKSIPKLIYLKKCYELVEYLKISLNNVIISNESFINRSFLVNYILNNSYNDPTNYRNISKAISTGLSITENYSRVAYIYIRSRAKYLKFCTTTSKFNTLRKPLMQQKYYLKHEM